MMSILRDVLMASLGPPPLIGILLGDWMDLLRENKLDLDVRYIHRWSFISFASIINSIVSKWERRRFGDRIESAILEPPIFVVGHWRSGTTFLHSLIAVDRRFACPTLFQVLFPHTFLTTESILTQITRPFLPRTRPTDNVLLNLDMPYEDEFAICVACSLSTNMRMVFPRREAYYARYLSLRQATPDEIERWKASLVWFLRKLALRYGRPLVLKSPHHTARVGLLLRMFPGARFVHIHRDPYAVFQSTRRLVAESDRRQRLHKRDPVNQDEIIIKQYIEMHECLFEDVKAIPEGQYHQIRFEDLERDPIGQVRAMYGSLGLPDFRDVDHDMQKYVASHAGYEKNPPPDLPEDLRRRIARKWRRCFEEWRYPT